MNRLPRAIERSIGRYERLQADGTNLEFGNLRYRIERWIGQ